MVISAIGTVSYAIAAGVLCLILSERFKIASIFLLLVVGVLLGPSFLGIVQPNIIEGGMPALIEIGVAIILFEGSLSLNIKQFHSISRPIKNLLTIGVLISFVGGFLGAFLIAGLRFKYCFILGAIMVVTGPTVISPILKRLPLKKHMSAILNWESILLDPIGAIIAILITEFILAEDASFFMTLFQFLRILVVGSVVGLLLGRMLLLALNRIKSISQENMNLMTLGFVLFGFSFANNVADYSGFIAVVPMGMMVASENFTNKEALIEFKGIISSLFIASLFILLAAGLSVQNVLGFGVRGWMFVAFMIFAVRPLCVFISVRKSELTLKEKFFLSFMAPRGIIAASTASLFTLLFLERGETDAMGLESLTYLVIASTVTLEGLSAGLLARIFKIMEPKRNGVLIVGAHSLARGIAKWLKSRCIEVKLVDTDAFDVRISLTEGFEVYRGNALDMSFLQEMGVQRIGSLIAITSNNEVNMLASQLGRRLFGQKASYQIVPKRARESKEISKDIGGMTILLRLPYLAEVNEGLENGTFTFKEAILPKDTSYTGPIEMNEGIFWPIFSVKGNEVEIVTEEHRFVDKDTVFGLFLKTG